MVLLRFQYLSLPLEKALPSARELEGLMCSIITILADKVAKSGGD